MTKEELRKGLVLLWNQAYDNNLDNTIIYEIPVDCFSEIINAAIDFIDEKEETE